MKALNLRGITAAFLFVCAIPAVFSAQELTEATASPAAAVVPIPLCRVLDTRTGLGAGDDQPSRRFSLKSSRCGADVHPLANGFAFRVTTFDWKIPERAARAAQTSTVMRPGKLDDLLEFGLASGGHLAVDLEGYTLPPGVKRPDPIQGATAGRGAAGDAAKVVLRPQTNAPYIGVAGTVHVDANCCPGAMTYGASGVLLDASVDHPYVVARLAASNNTAGFAVYTSADTEVMRARGDGVLMLPAAGYLNARTDFSSVNAPTAGNAVHRVSITNPRDAAGGATNEVTLFNAVTPGESGSPASTRFKAYALGDGTARTINFDSQLKYHTQSNQYHFRAFSEGDGAQGKETFWIKAATDQDSITGTRADLFLTGSAGFGVMPSLAKLEVRAADATTSTAGVPSSYRGVTLSNGVDSALVLRTLGSGHAQIATDTSSRYLSFATGEFQERMRIDASGNVAIGVMPSGYKLDVNGSMAVRGGSDFTAEASLWGFRTRLRYNTAQLRFGASEEGTWAAGLQSSGSGEFFLFHVPSQKTPLLLSADGTTVYAKDKLVVGTGTNGSAGDALVVNGNLNVTGNLAAKYQDVAEWVPATEDLTAGTVVVLNPAATNEVQRSTTAYDTRVAGVVSEMPGLILGEEGSGKEQIATTGRVRVKVDATAPIAVGDLLVTSDKPGMAMKSEAMLINGRKFHQPGTIVGKALEPLAGGTGEILVLLSMQ